MKPWHAINNSVRQVIDKVLHCEDCKLEKVRYLQADTISAWLHMHMYVYIMADRVIAINLPIAATHSAVNMLASLNAPAVMQQQVR